jgi:hypothetical protein
MALKNGKKLVNLIFLSAGCFLLRAEGFSFSLDVMYGGQGISKLQFFFIKKEKNVIGIFSFNFCHQNPGSGLDPYPYWIRIRILKLLDPDPYPVPDSMNPDHNTEIHTDEVPHLILHLKGR